MEATILHNCETSAPFDVRRGVRQGCVLAPTLFGIFFSVLLKVAFGDDLQGIHLYTRADGQMYNLARLKSKRHRKDFFVDSLLFADDAAFVAHSESQLQTIMDKFQKACDLFSMSVNAKKTVILAQGCSEQPTIVLNGAPLEVISKFCYLGSLVSCNLSLDAEIDSRIGKAATTFGRLRTRAWDNKHLTGGETGLGKWAPRAKLPGARSYAAAVADHERGILYVVGGWAGGRSLKAVHRYDPATDSWSDARPLTTGRSQCCAVSWRGSLWALGGCDAWRCLASTELLSLEDPEAGWTPGPMLPSARRSMGGCAWRGRLVVAGGSDGAASLRRVDWLLPGAEPAGGTWQAGPPLRRARAGLGLAELGGALYAAGGFSGREFLACVEWLPAPDAEWTMLADPPVVARTLSEPNPPSESPPPVCRMLSEQHPPAGADRPEENGQNEASAHI
ncbi:ring canal kelch homolog [Leguminivora glycinivorella]|uniref:ring canal kelch homolog n=1 Tax=Leguminivora glycinivorella TaxID=1035111 RepID=UPI00200D996F|nr:ring canal kelch homolog [Leguminivora glycinivorella]